MALLRVIVDQQISVQAGAAIWRKLAGSLGEICPDTILKADAGQLRRCGLSQAKTQYATCLAQSTIDGDLNLEELDQPVIELKEFDGFGIEKKPWKTDWIARFLRII